jgi:prefoldin subunit 5
MKAEEVLRLLEKHEDECNRRYADIQSALDKLDKRMWGLAILIIAAAAIPRLL